MKLRTVGAQLFHADRRTDMTKLIISFREIKKKLNLEKKWKMHFQNMCTPLEPGRAIQGHSAQTQLNLFYVRQWSVQPSRTPHDTETKPAVLRCACVINGLSAIRDSSHVTESNGPHQNNHNEV
jgi:hypothetical protein